MWFRCVRTMLLVVGCTLLFVGAFPILLVWHVHVDWETTFMGAKLLMLPFGALCLIAAAGMSAKHGRR